jgi:hypothetical protein
MFAGQNTCAYYRYGDQRVGQQHQGRMQEGETRRITSKPMKPASMNT